MKTIKKTFFVTGLGRSGTNLFANILSNSKNYNVVHEWQFPPFYRDGRLSKTKRFPIERFILHRYPFPSKRRGYGEVNSHLRHTLFTEKVGYERLVEKRAILLRNPKNVISSAMNRSGRVRSDFYYVCKNILINYAKLLRVLKQSKLDYECFYFEDLTTSLLNLQSFVNWTGINDVVVTEKNISKKVNENIQEWFPKWDNWDLKFKEKYQNEMDRISQEFMVDMQYER